MKSLNVCPILPSSNVYTHNVNGESRLFLGFSGGSATPDPVKYVENQVFTQR